MLTVFPFNGICIDFTLYRFEKGPNFAHARKISRYGINVLVIGHKHVGKTTIIGQLCKVFSTILEGDQRKSNEYDHESKLTADSLKFSEANLFDMPGLRDLTIRTADAFILTYATGDEESFDFVTTLIQNVLAIKGILT